MEPPTKRQKVLNQPPGLTAQPSFAEVLIQLGDGETYGNGGAVTWERPTLPQLNPKMDKIVFQQIHIEEHREPSKAISLQMFGVTQAGNSILAEVTGFRPYFYVTRPRGFRENDLKPLTKDLNDSLRKQAVLSTEMILKHYSLYRGNPKVSFIKIILHGQSNLSEVKDDIRLFEDGYTFRNLRFEKATYETDIPLVLRFMVDAEIVGMSWIEIPAGSYEVTLNKDSHCQIEIHMKWDAFISHKPMGEWSTLAPLRILSFDTECTVRGNAFPDAQIDPVLQIANMVTRQGENKPFIRNVFTLNTCADIVGTQVLEYKDELEMLMAWRDFVEEVDPDLIIGYNIANFDLPYLLDRARVLKGTKFPYLGRLKGVESQTKPAQFLTKSLGIQSAKETNLNGRIQLDLFQFMKREHELQSYKLNAVSAQFLDDTKEGVDFSMITNLQNGTAESRRRLAIYCLKDAYLPQQLMDKTMCLVHYVKKARSTGVPFNYILPRGQTAQDLSQKYHEAYSKNYIVLP